MHEYNGYIILDAEIDKEIWKKLCDKDGLEGIRCDYNVENKINSSEDRGCYELSDGHDEDCLGYWRYIAIKKECYDKHLNPAERIYGPLEADLPEVQVLIGKECYFSDKPADGDWSKKRVLKKTLDATYRNRYTNDGGFDYLFIKAAPPSPVTGVTMEEVCEKFGKPVKIIK